MAGVFIVVMWLLIFGILFFGGFYGVYSYILESLFRMRACAVPAWRAWIPFYGQVLLGGLVGRKKLGILAAVCPVTAVALGVWWVHAPSEPGWCCLLLTLLAGFMARSIIAGEIFRKWEEKRAEVYLILSMLTLGALRPIFLFALRKKVCMFSKNT